MSSCLIMDLELSPSQQFPLFCHNFTQYFSRSLESDIKWCFLTFKHRAGPTLNHGRMLPRPRRTAVSPCFLRIKGEGHPQELLKRATFDNPYFSPVLLLQGSFMAVERRHYLNVNDRPLISLKNMIGSFLVTSLQEAVGGPPMLCYM